MNSYTHTFCGRCPVNQQVICYILTIETPDRILVEDILRIVKELPLAFFHEDAADILAGKMQGKQTLRAHHHNVDIVTVRGGA